MLEQGELGVGLGTLVAVEGIPIVVFPLAGKVEFVTGKDGNFVGLALLLVGSPGFFAWIHGGVLFLALSLPLLLRKCLLER